MFHGIQKVWFGDMARGTIHIREDGEGFIVVELGNDVQEAEDFI